MGLYLQCGGGLSELFSRRPDDNTASIGVAMGDGATTRFMLLRPSAELSSGVGWVTKSRSQRQWRGAQPPVGSAFSQPPAVFATPPAAGVEIAASFAYAFPMPLRRRRLGIREGHAKSVEVEGPQISKSVRRMKTAPPALISFLNAARARSDVPIAFAECFAFTQANGNALAYTNAD